jgi:hypothetical protein
MKTNITISIAFLMALQLAACTTPPPTYKYVSQLPDDPQLSFESDFNLHTNFSVNIKAPEKNSCKDFDTAGYLLKTDSPTIYDKPNLKLQIKAPADKNISVSASHFFSNGAYVSRCGPLTVMFVPEKGKHYIVKMNLSEKVCFMSVKTPDNSGNLVPVKVKTLPECIQSHEAPY